MSALTETVHFIMRSANELGIFCDLVPIERYHRSDGYREFSYDKNKCDVFIDHIKKNWTKNVTIYVDVSGNLSIWKGSKFRIFKSNQCQFEEK